MTESTDRSPFVVSFDWLAQSLGQADLKIVDASWYLPAQNRDGAAEFAVSRIPGAVFFNQDRIVAPGSEPAAHDAGPGHICTCRRRSGPVADTDTIIVYDGPGMFTAPRVWWLLAHFRRGNAYVLDGGFDAWKARRQARGDRSRDTPGGRGHSMRLQQRGRSQLCLHALDQSKTGPARLPMRADRAGFPVRSPNRAKACVPATCPARKCAFLQHLE
jgi:3-mercaptopyruvate sulfurtransferase SseA